MAHVITGTVAWTDYVQDAYDRSVGYYLRDMPMFRQIVDKRPVSQAMPGQPVILTIDGELPLAITPLTELTDVDAVAAANPRQLSVTLNEYGNVLAGTLKLTKFDFTAQTIARKSKQLADNMVDSIDTVVRAVLDAGTNILYSTSDTTPGDRTGPASQEFNAFNAAAAVAQLRRRKAVAKQGGYYLAYIHPDVSYDLRMATGTNAWISPHTYQDTTNIYAAEIGAFQGARYVEHNRCLVTAGTPDVYTTYYFGQEALVECSAIEPQAVLGPVTDHLKRFYTLGWKALLGWAIYRQNALEQVRSTSSLEALNVGTYDPKA